MAAKIFVSYRREDQNAVARIRGVIVARLGKASVFMDVNNLLAGQRFDMELAKALSASDVLLAVIGPRWIDLLAARSSAGGRDYVREEIAEALARKLIVIPVRVGPDGQLPALPRYDELPEDIRDLVLHQKHDIAYDKLDRDAADLIDAILTIRRTNRPILATPRTARGWVGAAVASALAIGYVGTYYAGIPVQWPGSGSAGPHPADSAARSGADELVKARAADVDRTRAATAKADQDRKRAEVDAAELRAGAEAGRNAEEAGRQRVAAAKAEEEGKRAEADAAKLRADAAARRKAEEAGRPRVAAANELVAEALAANASRKEETHAKPGADARRRAPIAGLPPGATLQLRPCGTANFRVEPETSTDLDRTAADLARQLLSRTGKVIEDQSNRPTILVSASAPTPDHVRGGSTLWSVTFRFQGQGCADHQGVLWGRIAVPGAHLVKVSRGDLETDNQVIKNAWVELVQQLQ